MARDYADKLADALGAGYDSFTAMLHARGSFRLRRALAEDDGTIEEEEKDDEDNFEETNNFPQEAIHASRSSKALPRPIAERKTP
jgi:hypothetical protein